MKKEELDKKIIAYLEARVANATAYLKDYMERPKCCRMANDSLIRETVGHASPSDLDLVEKPVYVWKCATCGRCAKDDS